MTTTSTSRPRPRGRALVVAALAPMLLLGACGTGDPDSRKTEPSVTLPTGDVEVPEGVTLTEAGTTLDFGEPAVVAYEPNPERGSVLSMSVEAVQTGRIADFSAYQLDARTRASTPYYVDVKVENVGTGDLSRSAVPLQAVDGRSNTLIGASSFNNNFARCPSRPLPARFTAGKSAKLCLVYLVPKGGKLTEMSYRELQDFEPIVWEGKIEPAGKGKDDGKNDKKKDKKSSKGKKGAKKP